MVALAVAQPLLPCVAFPWLFLEVEFVQLEVVEPYNTAFDMGSNEVASLSSLEDSPKDRDWMELMRHSLVLSSLELALA